jgi:hypothetical protein
MGKFRGWIYKILFYLEEANTNEHYLFLLAMAVGKGKHQRRCRYEG